MEYRTVDFDPQDLVDYLFDELLAEGYVPTEDEIDFIAEIMIDYMFNIVSSLGIQIVVGEDE